MGKVHITTATTNLTPVRMWPWRWQWKCHQKKLPNWIVGVTGVTKLIASFGKRQLLVWSNFLRLRGGREGEMGVAVCSKFAFFKSTYSPSSSLPAPSLPPQCLPCTLKVCSQSKYSFAMTRTLTFVHWCWLNKNYGERSESKQDLKWICLGF